MQLGLPLREGAVGYRRAHLLHEAVERIDVVYREQPEAKYFVGVQQMAHVASGEVAAAVAVAPFLDRPLIEDPFRRLDGDVAITCDGGSV